MFDTAMNHKEINKKWHVEILGPQVVSSGGGDSSYAAPSPSLDSVYETEEPDAKSMFDEA